MWYQGQGEPPVISQGHSRLKIMQNISPWHINKKEEEEEKKKHASSFFFLNIYLFI